MGDVLGVGGIAQAGATLGAAGIQAGAVESAASTQADAAKYAAGLQSQAAANALGYQQNVFNTEQSNSKPFLTAGTSAVNQLAQQTSTPGKGLLSAYPGGQYSNPNFSFDPSQIQNDPGYQFQLQQGEQALQRSQAATGITGGAAAKAIDQYSQGLAGTEYQNAYSRALGTYQTNSQNNLANYSTNYNAFETNQNNQYNRLAGLAGTGQTANTQLASAGQNYANQSGAITQNAANQAGNYATQGANAGAAGTIGLGNALSGLSTGLGSLAAYQTPSFYGSGSGSNAAYGSGGSSYLQDGNINAGTGGYSNDFSNEYF